jgi:hypothetical protein
MGKYHSDNSICEEQQDLFNRAGFADNIVEILSNLDKDESFVIGLYAKWGYGKTSTINLIDSKLKNKQNIKAIYVNAWTLDGNISKIMFEIYRKITGGKNKSCKHFFAEFGNHLKHSDTSIPLINIQISDIGNILSCLESIKSIKTQIHKLLIEQNIKLIVFIDDIDRLESHQIINLFRMLSNVVDYCGIVYVLPFDKEFVCCAIEKHLPDKQKGDDYLEKIIQVPLHLPSISQTVIDRVFMEKLIEMLGEFSVVIEQEENERFQALYYYYRINFYIQSPRDINKILNVLRFQIPINHGEANIVDTIILEIIRVFDEDFYRKIRENKELLMGQVYKHEQNAILDSYINPDKKSDLEIRKEYAEKIFEQHYQIVQQLFPLVVANNFQEAELRKLQRIASEYYFDIFFASFDEQNGISDREIIRLLNNCADKQTIYNGLKKIINKTNFDIALSKILDNKDLINNKLDFCKALLDILELIPNNRMSSLMLNPQNRTLFTIEDIFENSNNKLQKHIKLLQYNYNCNRFSTLPFMIAHIVAKRENGKTILQEGDLQQYKQEVLKIIQEIARQDKMPINSSRDYGLLYYYWSDFVDSQTEISDYIKKHIKTADSAVDFISQFLDKWTEMGKNDYRNKDLNLQTCLKIRKFVDLKYLYDIIAIDKKYKDYIGIKKENLQSFHHPYQPDIIEISKVGNEQTDKFRIIVAKQFMNIVLEQIKLDFVE